MVHGFTALLKRSGIHLFPLLLHWACVAHSVLGTCTQTYKSAAHSHIPRPSCVIVVVFVSGIVFEGKQMKNDTYSAHFCLGTGFCFYFYSN